MLVPSCSRVSALKLIPPAQSDDEPTEAQLQEGMKAAGAKRSRVIDKEAKFEQFKKQQRLHPEYAGIYADTFLSTPNEMRQYIELLVFKEKAFDEHLMGVLLIQPHTTWLDLRLMVADELGIRCDAEEELVLSRGVRGLKAGQAFPVGMAGELASAAPERRVAGWHHPICPIQLTQNHKLVYPFFPLACHVLVVSQPHPICTADRRRPSIPKDATADSEVSRRAFLLNEDVSRGHEQQAIPVFNEFDNEPAPNDFTYVTQCVVNEGLRLLLGGPMRGPWPCPFEDGTDPNPEGMPYNAQGRFLHPPHTVDSVYECTLASRCNIGCRNRQVQLGPRFRLEVYRCGETEGRFVKGWGVRSPDFIPRGSFLCEYIGEYISDDEAESRGIRYDNQKMSRLMDVIGDGKDVVRMCIDATKFSNLGQRCATYFRSTSHARMRARFSLSLVPN